jgi:hypothetical protein
MVCGTVASPGVSPICPDESDLIELSDCDEETEGLSEQSEELDEDIKDLKDLIRTMEEKFKLFFGQVTFARLAERIPNHSDKPAHFVGYDQIVAGLDLSITPYTEWAAVIESAISAALK